MSLRPVTLYQFQAGQLQGYFRGVAPAPGIELTAAGERQTLTPPGASLLSLTHYLSDAMVGPEAPLAAARTEELNDDTLAVRYFPVEQWPVDALVELTVVGDYIDIGFNFHFREHLPGFEAQVLSSLSPDLPPAHVHVGGEWFRPALHAKELCFFSRDEAVSATIESGRWDFCFTRGYNVVLDDRGYDYPLLAYVDERSGWSLVQMLMIDECPSISLCAEPLQYNFSLVGRDVKAGEVVACHARLIYGPYKEPEDLLPRYHQFVRDVRGGTFGPQASQGRTPASR